MTEPRVLLVDDDGALLHALPQALELRMPGVVVDTCESAGAALELIAARDYDAIVTDIKMPGMDGLDLLDEIQRLRPGVPTLLITGHGERELAVRALRGGAYDFIQKPIEREYFVASLQRAVEKRRLDREVERQRLALERHARVLEHVADGVFLLGPDGRVALWNPAAEAITGLAADEVLGLPPSEVFGGWAAAAERVPVTGTLQSGGDGVATVPVEVGGRELWLSISGVRSADGTVYAFRDISGERAVDELKGEFLATVSHELRTPLAAIYGAAETLRRPAGDLEDGNRERLLGVIAAESTRLAGVVNDILLASHLDSGRLRMVDERVEPVELARGVIDAIKASLPDGTQVALAAPNAVRGVVGDADRLRQVLINLIENAVKYSPDGGRVEIRIEERDTRARISVRDEGLGIPPREQRLIFGKFYRVDPNLTRGIGGTGLGLYVCRELVDRMGGRIWVESEEGKGSTFFVELPLAEDGVLARARPQVAGKR